MTNKTAAYDPWRAFSGPNLGYVLEQYDLYQENPDEVDPELKEFFAQSGPPPEGEQTKSSVSSPQVSTAPKGEELSMEKIMAAVRFSENIRAYGHLAAKINPLNDEPLDNVLIHLERYGLTADDLKKIPAELICPEAPAEIKDGYQAFVYLKQLYTKTIAFEFQHVNNLEEKQWLLDMVESGTMFPEITNEKKSLVLKRLMEVEGFEKFLHRTYVGQKRFSIEGLDMLVPILDELISQSVQNGTSNVNIAMAHRGRLNVLAHVLGKPYEIIFSEFQHSPNKDLVPSEGSIGINDGWTGDVKYHLGLDKQITKDSTQKARLTLANNPSHLEVVGPIVEGYSRAAQETRTQAGFPEQDITKSLAILIHGDAAFHANGYTHVGNLCRLKKFLRAADGIVVHQAAGTQPRFSRKPNRRRRRIGREGVGRVDVVVHVVALHGLLVLSNQLFEVVQTLGRVEQPQRFFPGNRHIYTPPTCVNMILYPIIASFAYPWQ